MLNIGVLFRNNIDLIEPYYFFLRKATHIPYRIIAVDDGSSDGTLEVLNTVCGEHDVVLHNETNLGIPKSRNRILDWIKTNCGGYTDMLMMDSDCFIIMNKSVDLMVAELQKDSIDSVFAYIESFHVGRFHTTGICCNLIGKQVFEKIGEFDERYMHYYDDTDFHDRMHNAGFKSTMLDTARCMHMWGETISSGSEGYKRDDVLAKDKNEFIRKWDETRNI